MQTISKSAREVVEEMFAAFGDGDIDRFIATLSEDTVCNYHGTQIIREGTFENRDGVRAFFRNVLDRIEMISFDPRKFIVEDYVVVVLGREHQKVKRSGREPKQEWVQIYTVENDLISRMEEIATSEEVS